MQKDLVTIRVLADAAQAEMYCEILGNEGIVGMIPGAQHRSMLGMVGAYVEIPLKVPAADAERAAEIIDAIESEDAEFDLEEPSGEDDIDDEDEDDYTIRRKLKRIAFFIAFVIPGGGHFYVRRWWLGGGFLLAQLFVGLLLATRGELLLTMIWIPGLVLSDALGAVSRVTEINKGAPPRGVGRWLARGLPVFVALIVATIFTVSEMAPALAVGKSGRTVCKRIRTCLDHAYPQCELYIARTMRRTETEPHWLGLCARCMKRQSCDELWNECAAYCSRARISFGRRTPPPPPTVPRHFYP